MQLIQSIIPTGYPKVVKGEPSVPGAHHSHMIYACTPIKPHSREVPIPAFFTRDRYIPCLYPGDQHFPNHT